MNRLRNKLGKQFHLKKIFTKKVKNLHKENCKTLNKLKKTPEYGKTFYVNGWQN
jgi:hypothetical protein